MGSDTDRTVEVFSLAPQGSWLGWVTERLAPGSRHTCLLLTACFYPLLLTIDMHSSLLTVFPITVFLVLIVLKDNIENCFSFLFLSISSSRQKCIQLKHPDAQGDGQSHGAGVALWCQVGSDLTCVSLSFPKDFFSLGMVKFNPPAG